MLYCVLYGSQEAGCLSDREYFSAVTTTENPVAGRAFVQRAEFIMHTLEAVSHIARGSLQYIYSLYFILHSGFHAFASSQQNQN